MFEQVNFVQVFRQQHHLYPEGTRAFALDCIFNVRPYPVPVLFLGAMNGYVRASGARVDRDLYPTHSGEIKPIEQHSIGGEGNIHSGNRRSQTDIVNLLVQQRFAFARKHD